MTTGKTIALTRQNFVTKGMSLLFIMLSRLLIAFLLRNKEVPQKEGMRRKLSRPGSLVHLCNEYGPCLALYSCAFREADSAWAPAKWGN